MPAKTIPKASRSHHVAAVARRKNGTLSASPIVGKGLTADLLVKTAMPWFAARRRSSVRPWDNENCFESSSSRRGSAVPRWRASQRQQTQVSTHGPTGLQTAIRQQRGKNAIGREIFPG